MLLSTRIQLWYINYHCWLNCLERHGVGAGPNGRYVRAATTSGKGSPVPRTKGYLVHEIGDGVYRLTGGHYQMMFVTIGHGRVARL